MESNGQAPWSPIERVSNGYRAARQRLLVPEWADPDGQPLEIYYTPTSGMESQAVEARNPRDEAERIVYHLILKAWDEHNKPLFRWQDAHTLLNAADYRVILQVVRRMLGLEPGETGLPSVDEAKKNSGTMPPDISNSSLVPNSTNP